LWVHGVAGRRWKWVALVVVDRRSFLRRAGWAAGGVAVGAGVAAGYSVEQEHLSITDSGHAVGAARPPGLDSVTITYRVPTTEPVLALTFDDGPSEDYTAAVLDILADRGVTATFNLIGRHVAALPQLARRAAAAGHELGNHTWSHPDLSLARARQARDQLHRGAHAITSVTGQRPKTFRPPYGYLSGATMMTAAGMGYPIVLWDQEFHRHDESAATNSARLARAVAPGSIVLGHDGGSLPCDVVVAALPNFIDRVHERGLSFVTITDLLTTGHHPNAAQSDASA
jgi:peptidoglycan/xylan/chitin deacetylase (PgdA/CDA1 family)